MGHCCTETQTPWPGHGTLTKMSSEAVSLQAGLLLPPTLQVTVAVLVSFFLSLPDTLGTVTDTLMNFTVPAAILFKSQVILRAENVHSVSNRPGHTWLLYIAAGKALLADGL